MTTDSLIEVLNARIAALPSHDDWGWSVKSETDEDGDGYVMLTVAYPDDCKPEGEEYTDEPWDAFGDVPDGWESGMDNDSAGTVFQYIEWKVMGGELQ
jgi:hypothetical protein